MINWIAGNWPDRFQCLVNHEGVFNTRMMYFDTEELWFPEWDNRGTPWANPGAYRQNNPVESVGNWKTPMLVVHGALDYRVVETQGLGAFTACQRQELEDIVDEAHCRAQVSYLSASRLHKFLSAGTLDAAYLQKINQLCPLVTRHQVSSRLLDTAGGRQSRH